MKEVFISYESSNEKQALDLVAALENRRLSCWIAKNDVPKGEPYDDYIPKAIAECNVVVMLFSEASLNSPHVKNELRLAVKHGKKVIPFMLEGVELREAFEYHIESNNRISADQNWDEAVEELLISLADGIGPEITTHEKAEKTVLDKLRELGVQCPLCRSKEYAQRNDSLERLMYTEEGQNEAHRLTKKSMTLFLFSAAILFILILLPAKHQADLAETGLHDYTFFLILIYNLLFSAGMLFYHKKPEWFYERRRRYRVRRHIEVYHLHCNECVHKFRVVIDLDRNTVKKSRRHTQPRIKRDDSYMKSPEIKEYSFVGAMHFPGVSTFIVIVFTITFALLLLKGKIAIQINDLIQSILSIK